MPELPDVEVYVARVGERVVGQPLERVRLGNPFLLRSADPPLSEAIGRRVRSMERLGKRIVFGLEDELFFVLHLMIAGRLRWLERGAKLPGRIGLGAFDFPTGTLVLTEAGTKRRASLHLVRGREAMQAFSRGGIEPLAIDAKTFGATLTRESHTLKRALTDPRIFSGIGNAYSDEILHRARLSPVLLTGKLTAEQIAKLHAATQAVLREWTARLMAEPGFPEKVTAFREGMAVHGRYKQPCPDCGTPVQRIRYAQNETNYCPKCQTGGKLLADRALSRLLHGDWPKTLEELEEYKEQRR
jgi:formamidopyrimidine-DNA glycosylase